MIGNESGEKISRRDLLKFGGAVGAEFIFFSHTKFLNSQIPRSDRINQENPVDPLNTQVESPVTESRTLEPEQWRHVKKPSITWIRKNSHHYDDPSDPTRLLIEQINAEYSQQSTPEQDASANAPTLPDNTHTTYLPQINAALQAQLTPAQRWAAEIENKIQTDLGVTTNGITVDPELLNDQDPRSILEVINANIEFLAGVATPNLVKNPMPHISFRHTPGYGATGQRVDQNGQVVEIIVLVSPNEPVEINNGGTINPGGFGDKTNELVGHGLTPFIATPQVIQARSGPYAGMRRAIEELYSNGAHYSAITNPSAFAPPMDEYDLKLESRAYNVQIESAIYSQFDDYRPQDSPLRRLYPGFSEFNGGNPQYMPEWIYSEADSLAFTGSEWFNRFSEIVAMRMTKETVGRASFADLTKAKKAIADNDPTAIPQRVQNVFYAARDFLPNENTPTLQPGEFDLLILPREFTPSQSVTSPDGIIYEDIIAVDMVLAGMDEFGGHVSAPVPHPNVAVAVSYYDTETDTVLTGGVHNTMWEWNGETRMVLEKMATLEGGKEISIVDDYARVHVYYAPYDQSEIIEKVFKPRNIPDYHPETAGDPPVLAYQ